MSWQGLVGHDEIVDGFRSALVRGRLATSYLFVGPQGVGKRTFAMRFAQVLLCREVPAKDMNPCGHCNDCQQVLAGTHADIDSVGLPEGKSSIPIDLLIGDRDHRMRVGFCHNMAMKPVAGGRKIGIIDDADFLNKEGSNCLLKTLEEPPPRSLLILIGTSADKQLPTIRSRCQVIRFQPLSAEVLTELLVSGQHVAEPEKARLLAEQSDGGLTMALAWADDDLWEFRGHFLQQLSEPQLDTVRLARAVQTFVDSGSDASARRNRTRRVLQIAEHFYRELLWGRLNVERSSSGLAADQALVGAVDKSAQGQMYGEMSVAAAIDRCLAAGQHVDRNANTATLIACWADDLGRC